MRSTPRQAEEGYGGRFTVFGHGGCYGDAGHCDVPAVSPDETDLRPQHPLAPLNTYVTITDALQRILAAGGTLETVTLVPLSITPRRATGPQPRPPPFRRCRATHIPVRHRTGRGPDLNGTRSSGTKRDVAVPVDQAVAHRNVPSRPTVSEPRDPVTLRWSFSRGRRPARGQRCRGARLRPRRTSSASSPTRAARRSVETKLRRPWR